MALILVYLLAFMIEWFLMRFDLYRENLYAKIPLITTKWDQYDPERHYITTPSSSEEDARPDILSEEVGSGGAGPPQYMSPRSRRKRRYMASPGVQFSPIMKSRNEDEIELSVISPLGPQFVQLEDRETEDASEGVLKSTMKTQPGKTNKLKTPIIRRRGTADQRRVLSPDKSFGARRLAQIMFQQKINKSHLGSVDPEDEEQGAIGQRADPNMSVGCKQQ